MPVEWEAEIDKPPVNCSLHGHLSFRFVIESLVEYENVKFKGRVWRLAGGILTCDTGLCPMPLHDPKSLVMLEEALLACLDAMRDDIDPNKTRRHYNHCYNCPLGANIPNLGIKALT